MKNEQIVIIKAYYQLREELDALSDKLSTIHKDHMKCQKGCDECCMNFKVFPIEFFAILEQLKNSAISPAFSWESKDQCPLLQDHKCSIYQARPIICRTHGLPLLFMGEENWELSVCPLNFTKFEDENFTTENTLMLDTYNSRLFMLNKEFVTSLEGNPYTEFDKIELKELVNYLKD